MFFYVGAADGLLYNIDVILSGSPFPTTLTDNEPPFGTARFNFTTGITNQTTGSLQICDTGVSTSCTGLNTTASTLSLTGIYQGTGIF